MNISQILNMSVENERQDENTIYNTNMRQNEFPSKLSIQGASH